MLSDEYLESVYGDAEWRAAWAADPAGAQRKLLPVRVPSATGRGCWRGVTGFDLFGLGEAGARSLLLSEVAAAVAGRAKPAAKPGFPGRASAGRPRCRGFPGRRRGCGARRRTTRISPGGRRSCGGWRGAWRAGRR